MVSQMQFNIFQASIVQPVKEMLEGPFIHGVIAEASREGLN